MHFPENGIVLPRISHQLRRSQGIPKGTFYSLDISRVEAVCWPRRREIHYPHECVPHKRRGIADRMGSPGGWKISCLSIFFLHIQIVSGEYLTTDLFLQNVGLALLEEESN